MRQLTTIISLLTLITALSIPTASGQQIDLNNQIWNVNVIRDSGQAVIPLFDGWYPNEDGSKTICYGYFNMNTQQSLDVPHGENNYLESDYPGLDLSGVLLPTHFDPLPPRYRHVFCAFTINVPGDFSVNNRITWYLNTNRFELSVPGKVIPPYVMDEPRSHGRGDQAPLVRVTEDGPSVQGRTGIVYPETISAEVGKPAMLSAWVEHPDTQVWVGWSHHSGPGHVSFNNKEYRTPTGEATQVQTYFSKPGQYVIRMQTIDSIAAFEFYCCHTNAYYHVNVSN
ncbi:MAG: hypothetical protein KJN90_06075 [Gammaproteobacteria bacterium]|nr:hypothetical protein [Gammaproteobacteria bacterium]